MPMNRLWQKLVGESSSESADRRRHPRSSFVHDIVVRTAAGDTFHGFGRDISQSGLGAIIAADLQVGEELLIRFEQADPSGASPHVVEQKCVVRQRFGHRYGLEFVSEQHPAAG